MPTIAEVRAQYPQYQDMTDDQLAGALHKKFYSDMPVDEFKAKIGLGAQPAGHNAPAFDPGVEGYNPETGMVDKPKYDGSMAGALTEGSEAGLLGGFDDELGAGFSAFPTAITEWAEGKGFDMGGAYSRLQKAADERKQARRAEYPGSSLAGEVAGGLALGGKAAQSGASLIGRSIPGLSNVAPKTAQTALAAGEGAAYGGLYGAGEAAPGERLAGAGQGAAIGGLTGGILQAGGNALATRSARKVAQAAAPTSDDLGNASQALYRASEAEGVRFAEPSVKHLGQNLKFAAGRVNEKLRPKTAGYVDEIDSMFNGELSLEQFDEFRKVLGKEMRTASADDARTLGAMKRVVDAFADNVKPGQFTGDAQKAVGLLKQARETWARSGKTETIEKILDSAEVDGAGKYTQSGFANAVRREMRGLYKKIQSGKETGWTKPEIALIRQMAKGGSNSRIINLAAKFAPRGPMSIVIGQMLGSAAPGVGNIAVPLAGHVAGEMADRGAMNAAQALRSGAASGNVPQIPWRTTTKTAPFIGAGAAASTEVPRLLQEPRRR